MQFLTPGERSGDIWYNVAPTKKWLIYSVRACAEVNIILATYKGDTRYRAFTLSIGSPTVDVACVRDYPGGPCLHTDSMLVHYRPSCDESKSYWIRWDDESIEAGSSQVEITAGFGSTLDENVFLFYSPLEMQGTFAISYLAIGTSMNSEGSWSIGQTYG